MKKTITSVNAKGFYKENTIEELAVRFGVTVQSIKEQYAVNAKQLQTMYDKAVRTGKKVNGYTAEQLETLVTKFKIWAE